MYRVLYSGVYFFSTNSSVLTTWYFLFQMQGEKLDNKWNQRKIWHNPCEVHSSSRGTVYDDNRWHRKSQQKSWISVDTPKSTFINFSVNIWFLGSYEISMVMVIYRANTPDATRPFLVDITPSRVVFSAILVPRDVCDNSKMCVRARSLVRRLLSQTSVWRRMSLVTLENELMRCGPSPRTSESVKNWSLWTKKRPRPSWWNILLCDSGFYGSHC